MRNSHKKDKGAVIAKIAVIVALLLIVASIAPKIFKGVGDFAKESTSEALSANPASDYKMSVRYIDVGQGDSELITYTENGERYDVLVDAGPNESANKLVKYLKSVNVPDIDCMILTHPHSDHIGGADEVINAFTVKSIYMTNTKNYTGDSEINTYQLDKTIKEHNISVAYPKVSELLRYGTLKIQFLAPFGLPSNNINNYSLVTMATCGTSRFLFMGDAEKEIETQMIASENKLIMNVGVLKVGHHGSSTSSSRAFISLVHPKYAVISCAKNNEYGHPHREVMNILEDYVDQNNIVSTMNRGTITIYTNGLSDYMVA